MPKIAPDAPTVTSKGPESQSAPAAPLSAEAR